MKVSEFYLFDVVHAKIAQEVAKVVHPWPPSNLEKMRQRVHRLIRMLDWR